MFWWSRWACPCYGKHHVEFVADVRCLAGKHAELVRQAMSAIARGLGFTGLKTEAGFSA